MPELQVKPLPKGDIEPTFSVPNGATVEAELDAMVQAIQEFDPSAPDVIMAHCMGFMGRLTEIYLALVRIEGTNRKAARFRTMQLQKVMDLIDFQFKGASRLIEVRRQEVDLSK